MRTTLDLPDELFRQVKARAALTGSTIKGLLKRYVESGLRQADPPPARAGQRSRLPVITRGRTAIPSVTAQGLARLDQEDDRARLHRSFGR